MRALLSVVLSLAFAHTLLAADKPAIVQEEGQPVAANVERVLKSLDFLGTPLPKELTKSLTVAVEKQDAVEIQKLLDDRVAFVVNILRMQGIEVGQAKSEVKLKEGTFPAGSFAAVR